MNKILDFILTNKYETTVLVSLEINSKTFKVVNQNSKNSSDKIQQRSISVDKNLHFTFGMFLLPAMLVGKNTEFQNFLNLCLLDRNFELLDTCKKARLAFKSPIKVISGKRVISYGRPTQFFLHRIDLKQKKLELLRTVKIKQGLTSFGLSDVGNVYKTGFCCLVKSVYNESAEENRGEKDVLLKFDSNLRLRYHVWLKEGADEIESIFNMEGSRIAFLHKSRKGVYVIDMKRKRRVIQSAWQYSNDWVVFRLDESSGKAYALDLNL